MVRSASIAREDLRRWVDSLREEAEVIAPVRAEGGDALFAPIRAPEDVCWSYTNSLPPPRQHLLPQTDPIVAIAGGAAGVSVRPIREEAPRILLGVRSCDLSAIALLTAAHRFDLPDDTYLRRAERTTLIGLACTAPAPHCFCVCSGAGPFAKEGVCDAQLVELSDDRLLIEPRTDRGLALLESVPELLRPATDDELASREALEQRARQRFGRYTCHLGSAMRRVSTGSVADNLWRTMADWCLECGACTMVCPTCYCFSVKDRLDPRREGSWTRCRIWDSCQHEAFTLEASGHNPRAERGQRMRRRFFHKVSAQYFQRDGIPGCVGCGRCVLACMGAATMPDVVAAIREGAFDAARR